MNSKDEPNSSTGAHQGTNVLIILLGVMSSKEAIRGPPKHLGTSSTGCSTVLILYSQYCHTSPTPLQVNLIVLKFEESELLISAAGVESQHRELPFHSLS